MLATITSRLGARSKIPEYNVGISLGICLSMPRRTGSTGSAGSTGSTGPTGSSATKKTPTARRHPHYHSKFPEAGGKRGAHTTVIRVTATIIRSTGTTPGAKISSLPVTPDSSITKKMHEGSWKKDCHDTR